MAKAKEAREGTYTMTESQIEDIYSRLNTLTQKVNNLELLTGTIGTSQAAIAQIYSRLDVANCKHPEIKLQTRRF